MPTRCSERDGGSHETVGTGVKRQVDMAIEQPRQRGPFWVDVLDDVSASQGLGLLPGTDGGDAVAVDEHSRIDDALAGRTKQDLPG
ncbi:MAG: hypothetical protein M3228_09995 [Actinomycetota bacterium]|nr:hypothetical protein [Actinomycetota bacterium]